MEPNSRGLSIPSTFEAPDFRHNLSKEKISMPNAAARYDFCTPSLLPVIVEPFQQLEPYKLKLQYLELHSLVLASHVPPE